MLGGNMKKTNKLPYKKVRVIWQDICSSSQWYDDLNDVDEFTFLSTKSDSSNDNENNTSKLTDNQDSDKAEDDLPF